MAISNAVTLANLASEDTFVVDSVNNRVGINSATPTTALDVDGTVTATAFVGNGSGLTGVASTDYIITGTAATFTGGVDANQITVTGNVSVGGTLTYEDVKNVDSVGVVTARQGIRVGAGQSIGSTTSAETVVYYGDGSKLTGIAAGGDTLDITSSLFA